MIVSHLLKKIKRGKTAPSLSIAGRSLQLRPKRLSKQTSFCFSHWTLADIPNVMDGVANPVRRTPLLFLNPES